jgi:hypothetical protein
MKSKVTLLLLFALMILLAACGNSQSSTQLTPTPKPTIPPTSTPEPHHAVGDTVTRDGLQITLVSAKIMDPTVIPQHEQIFTGLTNDQTFLVLDEHVKNITTKEQPLAGASFVLQDEQGNRNFTEQLGVPGAPSTGIGGPVPAGMQRTGGNVDIVPKSTHKFFLVYYATAGSPVIWDINV